MGTEDFPVSQEFSWDGKSCFLPGWYLGLENLKPKNPRHTKVIWSFLMVLMLPGLSSPPAQVSLWLGNCNLALKSTLSCPVPHGKWFCPQCTEQTSVWFPREGWDPEQRLLDMSLRPAGFCSAELHPLWAPCKPSFSSRNPTPPFIYTVILLFVSSTGKQSLSLHGVAQSSHRR